ncbi:MAG: AI-2E family transporter [Gammaproteobacteria bacterium]
MTDSQKWLAFAAAVGGGYLVYLLAPVFTPFLVSALIAYLGDPLVDRLETWKLRRTWAVIVVFCGLFLALTLVALLLIPLIERQVAYLIARLPDYLGWIEHTVLPWLREHLGISAAALDFNTLEQALRSHWQQAGGIAAQLLRSVSASGLAVIAWLANLVLIPVVSFYLLRDWDHMVERVRGLIPRRSEPTVTRLARESDEVLGAFLRGQFLVMVALGIIYSVGLWIVGLNLALLIGMLAGLVSFVPYLGFILGVLSAGIAVLVQTHEVIQLLPVLAVFAVGQLLEGTVLTPTLVGDRIGLHPVAVIFAVLAGGQLFGFFGVLLALPVAAVVAVLLRHAHQRYVGSNLYEQDGGGR